MTISIRQSGRAKGVFEVRSGRRGKGCTRLPVSSSKHLAGEARIADFANPDRRPSPPQPYAGTSASAGQNQEAIAMICCWRRSPIALTNSTGRAGQPKHSSGFAPVTSI